MQADTLEQLDTPALVLDRARMEANIRSMRDRATELGVTLRPHLKTCKSADVARRMVDLGDPVTVSTLREAEYFAGEGFTNIFYAVAIAPQKLERVAALRQGGVRILLAADSFEAARAISLGSERLGVGMEVLIEIDSGDGRSGIAADAPQLLDIAAALGGAAKLAGVFTHGGHSYAARSAEAHAAVAEQERLAVTAAAARLREAGHACDIVSLGSTPSVVHARDLQGVTEVRAGVYVFFDLFQAGIGSCRREDIALGVLTTVIGNHPGRGQIVVDAGALALSKDISTHALGEAGDCGYGLVADAQTGVIMDGLYVHGVSQEHGIIRSRSAIEHAGFPIGRRLLILPNHACITAAAYDRYHVVNGSTAIEAVWPRVNGW
ncbi:alanine racemase [Luteimonas sp. A478]